MSNRLSSQVTGKLFLATLAATTLVLGGCITGRQIGDSGGGSEQTTTSGSGGQSPTSSSTESGSGGQIPTSGSGGAGGAQADNSIALFDSQLTQIEDQAMWLNPGEMLSPDTLIVLVSTEPQSCGAAVFTYGGTTHQQVLIGLPPELQAVGKYDISSTDVIAFGDFWLSDGMGNGGGGRMPLNQGTVEVLSIDSTSIKVRLAGLTSDYSSLEKADYLATRCP